jgi:hypothetical protein
VKALEPGNADAERELRLLAKQQKVVAQEMKALYGRMLQ